MVFKCIYKNSSRCYLRNWTCACFTETFINFFFRHWLGHVTTRFWFICLFTVFFYIYLFRVCFYCASTQPDSPYYYNCKIRMSKHHSKTHVEDKLIDWQNHLIVTNFGFLRFFVVVVVVEVLFVDSMLIT